MDIENKVRLAIKAALDKCDSSITPHICKTKKTVEGYKKLESLIISIMLKNDFTPLEAIAHIENEQL